MREQQLLHFGHMKPAEAVYERDEHGEPRDAERVAEFHFSALADQIKRHLEVKTVLASLLGHNLSVYDGQEKSQKDGYEQIEHCGGQRNRYFFGDDSGQASDPGEAEQKIADYDAARCRIVHPFFTRKLKLNKNKN